MVQTFSRRWKGKPRKAYGRVKTGAARQAIHLDRALIFCHAMTLILNWEIARWIKNWTISWYETRLNYEKALLVWYYTCLKAQSCLPDKGGSVQLGTSSQISRHWKPSNPTSRLPRRIRIHSGIRNKTVNLSNTELINHQNPAGWILVHEVCSSLFI